MSHSVLTMVDSGEAGVLNAYIALANIGGGFSLRLYTNDVTAGLTAAEIDALEAADFTQATFAGYAAVAFNSGWTVTEGNPTEAVNTVRAFERSSTGTAELVRGYYVLDVNSSTLQWFEQFDAPLSVEFDGDRIEIVPTLTADDVGGNAMAPGTMVMWAVDAAGDPPGGWLLCDGSAVSRSTFAQLFAAIGTAYGIGDGSTTFNLPDMRQSFPLGQSASGTGVNIGDAGGAIDHVHGLDSASSAALVRASDSSGIVRSRLKTVPSYTPTDSRLLGATQSNASISQGTELTGDSDTANPPFVTVNFVIKT
jgi:microcystin-dependent protein